jgi:hypothetical protein
MVRRVFLQGGRSAARARALLIAVSIAVSVASPLVAVANGAIIWGATVTLESERPASWARMVNLEGDEWLAAYAVFGDPGGSVIHVKRSVDRMRSWSYVTRIAEPGRQLDNAFLVRLANGDILLGMRSVVAKRSYRVQVYRSRDGGRSFRFLSIVDANERAGGSESVGVWEPFLYQLPDSRIVAVYANEKHSLARPAFSQVISQRISRDGGRSWGRERIAVAERGGGRARPGEPNVVRLPSGRYVMFYEVCGTENCTGHFSTSRNGVDWSAISSATIPGVYQNPQGVSLSDGTIAVTSNSARVTVSRDEGATWRESEPAFETSAWGALYQIGPQEVALVTGTGERPTRLLIRFGTLTAHPAQD